MKNIFLALWVGLQFLAMAGPNLRAAEITRSTAIEVSGKDVKLGVTFQARREQPIAGLGIRNAGAEIYLVEIDVAHVKRLSARVNYTAQSLSIEFRYIASGNPIRVGPQDIEIFRQLNQSMSPLNGKAGDALLSLISYIAEAPVNTMIDISAGPRSSSARSWTSLCRKVGTRLTATYDKFPSTVVARTRRLGQCYEQATACFGRCGKGCNAQQPARVQRFTQDCFNHDFCAKQLGIDDVSCTDEFIAAADDFFYAPDCGNMGGMGAWTDSLSSKYVFSTSASRSFTGTLTDTQCGNYRLAGNRPGGSAFTLSSSKSAPPPGCCASATWTGNLTSCSTATFNLTDCDGDTTFDLQMTR